MDLIKIRLKIDRAIQVGKKCIELWGTGNASREFLYVDDCAQAIANSIDLQTTPHPINIGTCSEVKINELVKTLSSIMGYGGDIVYNSDIPDGQPRRCLDTNKAYKILGFKAKTKLYEGLKNTVSWYYRHKTEEKFCDYFDHIQ